MKPQRWLVAVLLIAGCSSTTTPSTVPLGVSAGPVPLHIPGAADPNVTQANIQTTICVKGYTTKVRPPLSYTETLKRRQIAALHLPGGLSAYEEDHMIALSSGGSPTDPNNLWPEPIAIARQDDKVEDQTQRDICAGRITLAQGQARLVQLKESHGA